MAAGTAVEIMINGKANTGPAVAQAIADFNKLSAAGANVNQRIASLSNSLAGIKGVSFKTSFKEFIPDANAAAASIKGVKEEVMSLDDAFVSFNRFTSRAFAVGAVVGGITAVAAASYQLAESAQKYDILSTSYETMAKKIGASSQGLMAALQGVSMGMISNADLMLTANQAVMLSVVQSQDDMVKLMRVAMARGQAMGLEPTQAFGDLVRGIGRLSPLILDNLGIVTDAKNTYAAYAAQVGKTVEALTPMEKKQALLNRVFKESADVLSTPIRTNPYAQLQASLDNLKLSIGTMLGPEMEGIATGVAEKAQAAAKALDEVNQMFPKEDKSFAIGQRVGAAFVDGIKDSLSKDQNKIELINIIGPSTQSKEVVNATAGAVSGMVDAMAGPLSSRLERAQAELARQKEILSTMPVEQVGVYDDKGVYFDQRAAQEQVIADLERQIEQLKGLSQERAALIKDSSIGLNEQALRQKYHSPAISGELDEQGIKDVLAPLEERNKLYQKLRDDVKGVFVGMAPEVGAEEALLRYNDAMRQLTASAAEMSGISTEDLPFFNAEFLDKIKNPPELDIKNMVDDAMGEFSGLAQKLDKAVGTPKTVEYLDGVRHALTQMIPAWKAQGQSTDYIANVSLPNFVSSLQEVGNRLLQTPAWMAAFKGALNANESALLTQTKLVYDLSTAIAQLNNLGGINTRSDVLDQVYGQVEGLTPGLMNNMSADEALAWERDMKVQLRERYDQLKAMTDENGNQLYTSKEIDQILKGEVSSTQEWASSLDKVSSGVSETEKEFNKLKDTVRGVLDDALSLDDIGFDPNDAQTLQDNKLPRPDAINENARRLAAIAKEGLKDQSWLEEFKQEVPDIYQMLVDSGDPKASAAQALREFQLGLRPELLDKEQAKQRVKDMLIGDANMAQLAQEIAAEIAADPAIGMSLGDALSATKEALGIADKTSTMTPGNGLEEGLANATDGAALITGIAKKMEEAYDKMKSAGEGAGKQWGTGFMATVESGVSQPLIDLLVKLVTPGVMATVNAQNTQTTPP